MALPGKQVGKSQTARDPDAPVQAKRFYRPKPSPAESDEYNVTGLSTHLAWGVSATAADQGDDFELQTSGRAFVSAVFQTVGANTYCMPGGGGSAQPFVPGAGNWAFLCRTAATGGANDEVLVDLDHGPWENPPALP